jgi:hypothetical protein
MDAHSIALAACDAKAAVDAGDWKAAVKICKPVFQTCGERDVRENAASFYSLYMHAGVACGGLHLAEQAAHSFRKAAALDSQNPRAWLVRVSSCLVPAVCVCACFDSLFAPLVHLHFASLAFPNLSQALLDLARKKEPPSTDEEIAILGHLASALERYFCGLRCGLVQIACRLSDCELVFYLRFVLCCRLHVRTSKPWIDAMLELACAHFRAGDLVQVFLAICLALFVVARWRQSLVAITYFYSCCFNSFFAWYRLAPPGFKHCL